MQIRQEQIETFDAAAENKFRLQMADFLREESPETTNHLSDEELHNEIKLAEKEAYNFEITSSVPLSQFITIYFMIGKNFISDPDIHDYLSQKDVDQETKMQALVDELEKAV